MPKPLLCNPKPFKDQFRRDTKERKERRYCFVLGAGASVSSGIPSGKSLAEQWLREIYERQCPSPLFGQKQTTIEEWCTDPDSSIHGVNPKNPGAHYPQLFLARFPEGDPEGQRFIQESLRGLNEQPNIPSIGYAYLAMLLQHTDSSVVITTNFDNLAADALLLFTGSLPRVVGHERVASFAGLRDGQPLIAKIHGDVGFATTNDPDGVGKLPEEWHAPLREILRDHIPIFIGYDGNDGSLMDFLSARMFEAGRSMFRSGIYWCYRAGEGRGWKSRVSENERLRKLTETHQVHFVPIGDFDLWLMELGEACGVGDPEKVLRQNADRRVKSLNEQLSKARADQGATAPDPAVEASRAETREEIGKRLSEWDLVYKASAEKDPVIADDLYRSAVDRAPDNPGILGSYANFLFDNRKEYQAQDVYERALKADPNHASNLANYALFLSDICKDYDRAQDLYERALNADPNGTDNLSNYALFLKNVRKDYDLAQGLYERALKADPNHAHNLGNYANFLRTVRKDYDRAQDLYERALNADPNGANNLSNYANFLWDIRKDYDRAQDLYERVLNADPNRADNLSNYANFLRSVRKDYDRAQDLYEQALKADPNHANNLGNYAGFLMGLGKNIEGSDKLDRAIAALSPEAPRGLDVEVWFYAFAHRSAEQHGEAIAQLKTLLLEKGSRSPGWDLSLNIERAVQDGHPHSSWLPKLAAVITGEADPSVLADWDAWQNATLAQQRTTEPEDGG